MQRKISFIFSLPTTWTLFQGAKVLSENMIRQHAGSIKGQSVVEFGAGAGLPSLVALSLGARHVVATDYPSSSVIENLTRNLTSHCTSLALASLPFNIVSHIWADEASITEILSANNGEGFDIALAAECLWRHELHNDLAVSLYRSLRVRGRAMITFSHHFPGRESLDLKFFDIAKDIGLHVVAKSSFQAPHMWSGRVVDIHLYELEKS